MTYKKNSNRFYGLRPTNVYSSHFGRKDKSSEVLVLPVVYVCKKCGNELYRFGSGAPLRNNGDPHLTPKEVSHKSNGNCPKCGEHLDEQPDIDLTSIKVMTVD